MTTMIERVARAIYYASDMQRMAGKDPYVDDAIGRRFALSMAKAAIEEMREPSEGMCWRGMSYIPLSGEFVHDLKIKYQTMIDAALEEK